METANIQSVVENNIVSVALMNIQPSSYNPRKHFDEVSLAELAESIRQQGVLQPIGVRPIADTDRFEIVFGERRYRAALMAELTEISAVILHVSDETAAEMAVTENLQRKDVTPIEEANAYQKLMESGRYDVQSLAEQFGKNECLDFTLEGTIAKGDPVCTLRFVRRKDHELAKDGQGFIKTKKAA